MLKILLADLRHSTIGTHSAVMPLAIGFLATYTESYLKNKVQTKIFIDPNKILKEISKGDADVVALSNYVWNCELGKFIFKSAKEINPDIVTVAGGPEFPRDESEGVDYLRERSEIDFYVYQEGEVAFLKLIESVLNEKSINILKSEPINGVKFIDSDNNLITGNAHERLKDLDVIPSPYLSGKMEEFFDGSFQPFIESARGCPYACTFCEAASSWYNKVNSFTIERVKADLDYIAKRMCKYPDVPLAIADSNFGMLKRDEIISDYIGKLQDKFNWPHFFNVSTGKSQHERIIKVAKNLKNKLVVSLSVQSLNEQTLSEIKRKNLGDGNFERVYDALREIGINSYSDVIIPMPLETKETFFEGMRKLSHANIDRVIPFTTMMLKGTEFASSANRKKFGMKTKFRVLPNQFGEYNNKKIIETEEVCIETNTMPFSDYLECRGLAFIMKVFSEVQFDVIFRLLREFKIDRFEFFETVWKKVQNKELEISKAYYDFIDETRSELFDTKEDCQMFYQQEKNYKDLLEGLTGNNVMRKCFANVLIDHNIEAINIGFDCLKEILKPRLKQKLICAIEDVRAWTLVTRNINDVFKTKKNAFDIRILNLNFDVPSWYDSTINSGNILSYEKKVSGNVTFNSEKILSIIKSNKKMFSQNIYHWVPKAIENSSLRIFWGNFNQQILKRVQA